MFCSECGQKVEVDSKFCDNCGAKITNDKKPEVSSNQNLNSQPQNEVVEQPKPNVEHIKDTNKKEKKEKKKGCGCLFGILVVVLILAFFFLG